MNRNGYFMTVWLYFWNRFIKNSVIYKVLCSLYGFISAKWRQSRITSLFRRVFLNDGFTEKSLAAKLLFLPFRIIEWIQKKVGTKLTRQKENSYIIRSCKYFLHNLLALNLRFLGILLSTMALSSLAVSLVKGGGIRLEIVTLVVGLLLIPFEKNFTEFFKGSFFVGLIERIFDTKLSFDFYYMTKCGGTKSAVCAAVSGVLAGLIAGFTSPLYAILCLGGLWFFFMVLYKVEFGVFVTVFAAPILPTMLDVGLSLLCLFSLLIKALTTKKFKFKTDGMGFMVLALLGIYLLASLTSFVPVKGLQIWAVYFAFMVFYFVVVNTVKTKKQLFDLLTVFCLSGLCVCIYGILQYVFGWNVSQAWMDEEMFEDIKMRIYSTLENPNVLGEYILLTLPVAVGLMWKKRGVLAKLFYGGAAAVMGLALILTFSRGCWIGIMAAAAVFVTFAAGKLWGLALLVLPIIPMMLPESIINRFLSIGDMKDSSTSYRVYIWMGTLLLLKDFWLSGIGPGTEAFTKVYPFYSYSMIVAPHSHNLFLQIMVESGVLGILAFVILAVVFVRKLAAAYQVQGKLGELSVMAVAIGGAVMGFLVQGLFDNCFYNYRVFMIFWTVLAFGSVIAEVAKTEKQQMEVASGD